MMSKVINIIKEYSDEESKRGKALQKLSWEGNHPIFNGR